MSHIYTCVYVILLKIHYLSLSIRNTKNTYKNKKIKKHLCYFYTSLYVIVILTICLTLLMILRFTFFIVLNNISITITISIDFDEKLLDLKLKNLKSRYSIELQLVSSYRI